MILCDYLWRRKLTLPVGSTPDPVWDEAMAWRKTAIYNSLQSGIKPEVQYRLEQGAKNSVIVRRLLAFINGIPQGDRLVPDTKKYETIR